MSDNNGNGKILGIDQARRQRVLKPGDYITVSQAHDMVIQECAAVHEHYLKQIPPYVARMIQDALMSYGLIQLQPGSAEELAAVQRQMATPEAPAVSENAGGDTTSPDTNAPVDPAA